MKNKILTSAAMLFAASLMLVSCGTSRQTTGRSSSAAMQSGKAGNSETVKLNFLRKVYDNEVYASCITSKMKFTLNNGKKDITVSGSLKMKRDDVIRLQLTPFGLMEAGRLEFTKDYVLIVDRINKRYVKEDYSKVDFLQKNGLDFYALQALFWNQLYMPGSQKVSDSTLKSYTVDFTDAVKGTLIQYVRGNMNYEWTADQASARITQTKVTYSSSANGTTQLTCDYGSFKPLQSKQFPTDITMKMASDAVKDGRTVSVNIELDSPNTSSDWETRTEVSSKYRKVTVEEAMQLLTKM